MVNKYDLDTPALPIDLDTLETNTREIAEYFKTVTPGLRPHIKTHKIPKIDQMQIDARRDIRQHTQYPQYWQLRRQVKAYGRA